MKNITNITFGSDVKFTSQEVKLGSDFFNKESLKVGKLTEDAYLGNVSVTDIKTDQFPLFNQSSFTQSNQAQSSPQSPSAGPYIWKYR